MAVHLVSSLLISSALATREQSSDPRIVNGIPTTATDYPFIVDLRYDFSFAKNGSDTTTTSSPADGWGVVCNDTDTEGSCVGPSFCTGSLVQLDFPVTILTAAHCLYNMSNYSFGVFLGRSDQDGAFSSSNNYSYHKVWQYVIHPDYNQSNTDNDIGLMFLDDDLSNDGRLDVVTLNEDTWATGTEFQVIGYGANHSGGAATDTLEYTTVYAVNDSYCEYVINYVVAVLYNDSSNFTLTDNMFCAFSNNSDSCQGDSGGPLIAADTTVQYGVTSWGIGCNWGVPGVYADVSEYVDWIQEKIHYFHEMPGNGDDGDGVGGYQLHIGLVMGVLAAILNL